MFIKRICTCLLILLIFNGLVVKAGGEVYSIGSRQAGMGRTSVALTDFWNIQNNQAGIALIDKISVGIYYESRFLISELGVKSAAVVVPTKIGVLGASFNHFGYSLYSDVKIGLAYARSFGPYFRIGLQLDYLQTTIGDNYGSKSNITFELGIQSDVTEVVTIGAYVYNPIRVKLADYNNEKVPSIFRLGVGWKISKNYPPRKRKPSARFSWSASTTGNLQGDRGRSLNTRDSDAFTGTWYPNSFWPYRRSISGQKTRKKTQN